ncbi:hypothetical protein [Auritidibacter sp. NML100628]|uniref:DUF7768 domain-containing protein n=1 Tax=Auritidibacter sp. NML100628 TaxID=2170742 RepID=UPI001F29D3E9|nr:hypothetical protein [Auritidibacter sp. NML100628]
MEYGYRTLVYICSQYAGDVATNVELAREFCAHAVSRRKIPLAPHLLFPQFMDVTDPRSARVGDVFQPDPADQM